MKSKLQTRNILIIVTTIILLFSLFLVFSYIFLIEHVNRSLNEIDQRQLDKLELVRNMTDVVRQRSELMLSMYIEQDEWKRDELFIRFHDIAEDFINARDSFVALGPEPSEKNLLSKILETIRQTEEFQSDIVDRLHSGNMQGVHADIAHKDLPVELSLLGNLDALAREVTGNSRLARENFKDRYKQLVLAFEIVSIVIVTAVTMLMWGSLKRVGKIEKSLIDRTESLSRDATHDPLTNIYNRRWLQHKIEDIRAQPEEEQHVLLYLDLDGFKPINDENGHAAGDEYLVRFCREVEKCIRQADTFCRLGGDEFAVFLEGCSPDDAAKVAATIVSRVAGLVVNIDGNMINTTCSIGLYEIPSADMDFGTILSNADALCYQAKREGRNRVASSEPVTDNKHA